MTSPQSPICVPNQVLTGFQPGTQVSTIQAYASPPDFYPHYKGHASMFLGIIQIILGGCSVLFSIISIFYYVFLYDISPGIWCAVLYILAGGFGIAAKNSGRCFVKTHMILSIIAAVSTIFPLVAAAAAIWYTDTDEYDYDNGGASQFILSILLAFVTVMEFVTAVVASVLCCKAVSGQNPYDMQRQSNFGAGGVQYSMGVNNQMFVQQPAPSQPYPAVNIPYAYPSNSGDLPPPYQYEEGVPMQ